jgi:hypothetical protein
MPEPVELYTDCYKPAKPFPALRREVASALTGLTILCKALHLNRPRIFYAADLSFCACYCAGSQDWPVIVLDVESFRNSDLILWHAVTSTIVHELLHAYLETLGMNCGDYEHPEDEVEDLARRYCNGLMGADELTKALDAVADAIMTD